MKHFNREITMTAKGRDPASIYELAYGNDAEWQHGLQRRLERLEAGRLDPKTRELAFVAGYLVHRNPDGARYHQDRARQHGATTDDFRLLVKILDFYRGLRTFQDAQKLLSFWRTGIFPEFKPPVKGTLQDIFAMIVETRKYIANGFRVYSADGEWLRIYLARSDAIKRSPKTLDERAIQLLSMALTLANHRYSDNCNDGCIQVHEDKARSLGATQDEILEVVQILEVCDSITTAWEGTTVLDLTK
jgi:alkylhydroperoxidase/carboxymuconolactone decarboxylase family protein YurZ